MNIAGITPAQWVPTVLRGRYKAHAPPLISALELEVEQEGETGLFVCSFSRFTEDAVSKEKVHSLPAFYMTPDKHVCIAPMFMCPWNQVIFRSKPLWPLMNTNIGALWPKPMVQ